jgi:hypothetical protein
VTDRCRPCLVEVDASGLRWAKSSASNSQGDDCLEVAADGDVVLVRSSHHRAVRLALPSRAWAAFLSR